MRYDDLRDENLFGIIERLQTKYGIIVGNSMENTWDLSIDVSRKAEFPDYMSLFNYFKSALTEVFGTEPKCEHQHSTIEECIPDAEYQQKDYESTFFDVGERAAWLHELTECTHALDIKLFKFGG